MHNSDKLYQLFKKSTGVSIDTRTLQQGNLFFAISGDNFDGHNYVESAINKGALACIVDRKGIQIEHGIQVDDTIEALQNLANYHRKVLDTKIISITGSNGKTTTKELCQRVLSTCYKTICTRGNLNNHLGVPLTLLTIENSHEVAIVEMGANHIGEIKNLCEIADPDMGMITNIGKAHLEGFGGYDGVIKAKSEMYEYLMSHKGLIFCNQRDPLLVEKLRDYNRYSLYDPKDLILISEDQRKLSFHLWGYDVETQLVGNYNIANIAAAISIGQYFNISIETCLDAIRNYVSDNNRSEMRQRDGVDYYLDAYNANPSSMKLSIDSFLKNKANTRILIMGDMLELGSASQTEHKNILTYSIQQEIDEIFTVGTEFKKTGITNTKLRMFENAKDIKDYLHSNPFNKGSLVLLKGSRGIGLEKILG